MSFKVQSIPVYFCDDCNVIFHTHKDRTKHKRERCTEACEYLQLLSVICIETSHYVCFTRDSEGHWVFSDSMANRLCKCALQQHTHTTSTTELSSLPLVPSDIIYISSLFPSSPSLSFSSPIFSTIFSCPLSSISPPQTTRTTFLVAQTALQSSGSGSMRAALTDSWLLDPGSCLNWCAGSLRISTCVST